MAGFWDFFGGMAKEGPGIFVKPTRLTKSSSGIFLSRSGCLSCKTSLSSAAKSVGLWIRQEKGDRMVGGILFP